MIVAVQDCCHEWSRQLCNRLGSWKHLGHTPPWPQGPRSAAPGAEVASFIALWCYRTAWYCSGWVDCKCQLYVQLSCPVGGSWMRHVSGTRGCDEETIQTPSQGFCRRGCLLIAATRAEFVVCCWLLFPPSAASSLHLLCSPESSASSAVGHFTLFLVRPPFLRRLLMKVSSRGPQTAADPLTAGAARPVRGTFNCFLGSLTGGDAWWICGRRLSLTRKRTLPRVNTRSSCKRSRR